MNNIQLKIKNFGPIINGFEGGDGFMSIPKVTLFCGPQGSGKSTIAKVLSSMIWLEKAASFVSWKGKDVEIQGDKMIHSLLDWHGLASYFHPDMELGYRGDYLILEYSKRVLRLSTNNQTDVSYRQPKIMYIPAERNFLHLLDTSTASKTLPHPLRVLLDEFILARKSLKVGEAYQLPVNGYCYMFDAANSQDYIANSHNKGETNKTPVGVASSGLQSVLPLLLITDYLCSTTKNATNRGHDVSSLLVNSNPFIYKDDNDLICYLGTGGKMEIVDLLNGMMTHASCFINIVEEPEQNLFPPTQRSVLRHLIRVCNALNNNRLILSTHSPYIIADLVAAMRVDGLLRRIDQYDKYKTVGQVRELAHKCYPQEATINAGDVCLYETSYNGTVSRANDGQVISDSNFLNRHLALSNMLFQEIDSLEEMAEGLGIFREL